MMVLWNFIFVVEKVVGFDSNCVLFLMLCVRCVSLVLLIWVVVSVVMLVLMMRWVLNSVFSVLGLRLMIIFSGFSSLCVFSELMKVFLFWWMCSRFSRVRLWMVFCMVGWFMFSMVVSLCLGGSCWLGFSRLLCIMVSSCWVICLEMDFWMMGLKDMFFGYLFVGWIVVVVVVLVWFVSLVCVGDKRYD